MNHISEKDESDARAYTFLLEGNFFLRIMFLRAIDPRWTFSKEQGVGGITVVSREIL